MEKQEIHHDQLREYLNTGDVDEFRSLFSSLHVYERGQFYLDLKKEERLRFYELLSPEELAEVFDILEEDNVDSASFLEEMIPEYAAEMVSQMYSDNAVDLLNQLDDQKKVADLLTRMDTEDASDIKDLMVYQDDTAGSIMTREFVQVVGSQTVKSSIYVLKKQANTAETIYYIYVTDSAGKLKGVISLKDLIINDDDLLVKDIMNERVISVNVTEDQEDVAQTFRDYDLLALPVVDDANNLQGIVTVDDIIDVIDDEAASDYSGLAGVDTEEVSENPFRAASKRLPWLVALLFLGIGTSLINDHYQDLVKQSTYLIMFLTTIMGTSGNAGTQSLAVAVRRIASKDEEKKSFVRMIISELATGMITGLIVSVAVFFIVYILKGEYWFAVTVGISMFAAVNVGNLAGSFIPIGMEKLGFDPAVASGPFISTLSDLTSVIIYYNVAILLISKR